MTSDPRPKQDDNESSAQQDSDLLRSFYLQTKYALQVGPEEWARLDSQGLVVNGPYSDFFSKILKAHVVDDQKVSILEAGAGTGNLTRVLARLLNEVEFHIDAVDVASTPYMTEDNGENVTRHLSNLDTYQNSSQVDLVLSALTCMYLNERTIFNLLDQIKEGGVFASFDFLVQKGGDPRIHISNPKWEFVKDYFDFMGLSTGLEVSLPAILKKYGMTDIEVVESDIPIYYFPKPENTSREAAKWLNESLKTMLPPLARKLTALKGQIKEDLSGLSEEEIQNQINLLELIATWTQRSEEITAEVYAPLYEETLTAEILELLKQEEIVVAVSVVKVSAVKP